MFPAIRNAEVAIKATELVETLVLRARHGKAAAHQAAERNSTPFVKKILGCYDNPAILLRTAVEQDRLTGDSPSNWADGLGEFRQGNAALLQLLSSNGNFDAAVADMARGALHTAYGVGTGTLIGAETMEGAAKPVRMGSTNIANLAVRKVTNLSVVTKDTLKLNPNVGPVISALIRDGVIGGVDSVWTSALITLAGSGIASVGNSAAAVLQDIDAVLDGMSFNPRSRLHWIVPVAVMKKLMTMTDAIGGARTFPGLMLAGGPFPGGMIKPCDSLTTDVLVVDATGFVGDVGELITDASSAADMVMETEPGSSAAQVVSMFQTDSTCFKAERYFGFTPLRPNVVGRLTGVAWGTPESGSP